MIGMRGHGEIPLYSMLKLQFLEGDRVAQDYNR